MATPRSSRLLHLDVGGRLLHRREAEPLVARVELDIVLAHEDIAEDVERAGRRGHVHTRHGEEALPGVLDDVILLLERVRLAADRDVDVGSGRRAVDEELEDGDIDALLLEELDLEELPENYEEDEEIFNKLGDCEPREWLENRIYDWFNEVEL